MSVAISLRDTLELTIVPGDMTAVANALNIAGSKGLDFVVMQDTDGNPVAFRMENITVMKETEDGRSIFG
jgi:hypothetical protein